MRRIAVVSTSRADYGHLYWVLRELAAASDIDLRIFALGSHASPRFGETWRRFEQDGFKLDGLIECLLDSDSDVGMAKTIGLATLGLADALAQARPDLLLLIADRYEMLAPAAVALALRIPIAHIEGGDISEGAIDDAVRHALTKMAHIHFVPTRFAERRVRAMGEEAWRVHRTGAPSLDHLRRSKLPQASEVMKALDLPVDARPIVVAWHPVTLIADPAAEAAPLFEALAGRPEPIVFCFPNSDAGRERIIQLAESFVAKRVDARLVVNIEHLSYWRLLHQAAALVGNSSSGIMESPSLALPCVNVGDRQRGRHRAANILDTPASASAIAHALQRAFDPTFVDSLRGMENPYGDGDAARRIVDIIRNVPIDGRLLHKRSLPLATDSDAFVHEHES